MEGYLTRFFFNESANMIAAYVILIDFFINIVYFRPVIIIGILFVVVVSEIAQHDPKRPFLYND